MKVALPALRKIGILLVGVPLLIVGIILIPLPGPGLLVCLAALLILAQEFSWAHRYTQSLRAKLSQTWGVDQRPDV